jgi:hypothetical protein
MSFNPVKIKLKSPVMHGNAEIADLVIAREMVAGDLRGMSVGNLTHDDLCELTSRLTGVPTPVIRQLKMPDYMEVSAIVSSFFDDSPRTGGTG